MTVLLAEQDPLMRHTLQSMLGRAGFGVVDAVSFPEAALPPDAGDNPAVLITNARHGRGMTLPCLVRETRRCWPQLRVLLISGYAADPEEVAAVDRFLPKPFSGKILIQAVKELAGAAQPPARAPCPLAAQGWPA